MKRLIIIFFAILPFLGSAQDVDLWRHMADSLEHAGKPADACFYRAKVMAAKGDAMHAMSYIKRGVKGGSADCTLLLGKIYEAQDKLDEAAECYQKASSLGSVDAMMLYANALLFGKGVEADPQRAYGIVKGCTSLLSDGEPERLLGSMHLLGQGCEKNIDTALYYLDLSATKGNTQSMMLIGEIYADGKSLVRDTLEALRWYQRAADSGSVRAMLTLAASHRSGNIVPKDRRAVELYQRAADLGSAEAMCRLGICYETGDGVTLNSQRAYELYSQASEMGFPYAMYLLARCYVSGTYVKQDLPQAAQWFLKGAEAGNKDCCYAVGLMYANGDGVKQDAKEAKKWPPTRGSKTPKRLLAPCRKIFFANI